MGTKQGTDAERHQQNAAGIDPDSQTKRTDDCSEKEGLTMIEREKAETMIGNCLEIIRLICLEYKPDFDVCSLCVMPHSTSANIIDDDRNEYDLKYEWREDDEE